MKFKSPKLILGIILLIVAVVVLCVNPASYWIAIALVAVGLIFIISCLSKEKIAEPVEKKETLDTSAEKVVEPVEHEQASELTEENAKEPEEEKKI
ncbi:hypothetical protein B6D52_01630 [Candidatus Parcubacteria bacterium 4484_255]|nr:MAG: hypothetical protein B6D52_01630 [Candidatus Parcubacteria bacterium 4484_255]